MQVRSYEITLSSASQPNEGEVSVPLEGASDALVAVQGSSDVWAVWHVPVGNIGNLGAFSDIRIEPVPDDPLHLSVKATALLAEKRVLLKVYVLGT